MIRARAICHEAGRWGRFGAAAWLIAASLFSSPAHGSPEPPCPATADAGAMLLALPEPPRVSQPVQIVAVVREPGEKLALAVVSANGTPVAAARNEVFGYAPRGYGAYFPSLPEGSYRAALSNADGTQLACLDFEVVSAAPLVAAPSSGVWRIRRDWDASMEALFSAFVAKLFYVPQGANKGWHPLHGATEDPFRNFLYGVLGRGEDNPRSKVFVKLEPDCADLPYHVRAYFAWKLGLPMLFNRCDRGSSDKGSTCTEKRDNTTSRFNDIADPVARFNAFVAVHVGFGVQTGNLRTLPGKNDSDTYPLALTEKGLRPGSLFVDPGGHILLVSGWEPETESSLGALYGVDAHPDLTVSHKMFGRGSFVFNHRVPTGGFKAFRPVVRSRGGLRFLGNGELGADSGFPPYSDAQAHMPSTDRFYDEVYALENPTPADPRKVLRAKIDVLHTAMKERVQAVRLGAEYMESVGFAVMPMPQGPAIFETNGPWEIYSTPARDMRCFLALDDALEFPSKAASRLEFFAVPEGTRRGALEKELAAARDALLAELEIDYTRSDGSTWTLSLAEVAARQKALEMAYNPNDCPEIRWGAPEGSAERSTCARFAPREQVVRMLGYRYWFSTRHRPDQK